MPEITNINPSPGLLSAPFASTQQRTHYSLVRSIEMRSRNGIPIQSIQSAWNVLNGWLVGWEGQCPVMQAPLGYTLSGVAKL